jgi:hypothetical protein
VGHDTPVFAGCQPLNCKKVAGIAADFLSRRVLDIAGDKGVCLHTRAKALFGKLRVFPIQPLLFFVFDQGE